MLLAAICEPAADSPERRPVRKTARMLRYEVLIEQAARAFAGSIREGAQGGLRDVDAHHLSSPRRVVVQIREWFALGICSVGELIRDLLFGRSHDLQLLR